MWILVELFQLRAKLWQEFGSDHQQSVSIINLNKSMRKTVYAVVVLCFVTFVFFPFSQLLGVNERSRSKKEKR